jgi:cytochrome c peroxidase
MERPTYASQTRVGQRWTLSGVGVTAGLVLTVVIASYGGTSGNQSIFQPFLNDDGKVQSASAFSTVQGSAGTSNIDSSNTFFKTSFGTNGQTCATCHRPADGMTVHVTTIQNAFESSGGTDPLFRFNDTANDPNSSKNTGSVDERREAYSLTLELGVTRIGKTFPPNPEFVVATQTTEKFGTLPLGTSVSNPDPQQPGLKTLSLFRRPLVNTNMRFDSAVLWDGRADIRNLRGQVTGAAKTLLLNHNPTAAEADDVARFQLAVFTDQVIDDRSSFPESFAGNLSAQGATGGVKNLVAFAFNPTGPCVYTAGPREHTRTVTPDTPTYFPTNGTGSLTPSTCVDVVQGGPNMTTFQAWASIPVDNTDVTNISRRRIAHGEDLFNTKNMIVPSDIVIPGLTGNVAHCTTCHSTNNIGNNPEASFFVRLGSDSVRILQELADAHPEVPSLQDFVTRTAKLPQYCLRNILGPPLPGPGVIGGVDCGSFSGTDTIPGDVTTSDPGHAMVTGKWVDIGKFKPPILRGLATRSPYFHGSAADSTVNIIEFYNARFNMGLSQDEKNDLVRFVEAH